uniref:Chemotaxis protein n=1 Tax=Ascaris lumbricoides TaxID=6252 RepID=A0A0M3IWS4_ASCLU
MKPMGTSDEIPLSYIIDQRTSEQVAAQSRASKIATVHELMRSVGRALGDKAGGTAALFERSFSEDDSRLAKVVRAILE